MERGQDTQDHRPPAPDALLSLPTHADGNSWIGSPAPVSVPQPPTATVDLFVVPPPMAAPMAGFPSPPASLYQHKHQLHSQHQLPQQQQQQRPQQQRPQQQRRWVDRAVAPARSQSGTDGAGVVPQAATGTRRPRGAPSDGSVSDDGSGPRPETKRQRRRLAQQELDRKRRKRVTDVVRELRSVVAVSGRADKTVVLESSLAEIQRLRAENKTLRAATAEVEQAALAAPASSSSSSSSSSSANSAPSPDNVCSQAYAGDAAADPRTRQSASLLHILCFSSSSVSLTCVEWRTFAVVDMNAAAEAQTGFTRAELVGASLPAALAARHPSYALNQPCARESNLPHGMSGLARSLSARARHEIAQLRPQPCCGTVSLCCWREDEAVLLAGLQQSVACVRTIVNARNERVRMLLTRWLVRDPATGRPAYFMCLAQEASA